MFSIPFILYDSISEENESISEEDDSVREEGVWHNVMKDVISENDRSELTKPGESKYSTKKLGKAIRFYVVDITTHACEIEESEIYEAINEEQMRLEKNGYEEDEAIVAAWKNRQFLLKKKVIQPFLEQMAKQEDDDSKHEEEEDDEINVAPGAYPLPLRG